MSLSNYDKDAILSAYEQQAIEIVKVAFNRENLPFDSIALRHRSDAYLTLVYKDRDFCRIKAGEKSTWVSLDVWSAPSIKGDARFLEVTDRKKRHWKICLDCINDIATVTDLIVYIYKYIDSPESVEHLPRTYESSDPLELTDLEQQAADIIKAAFEKENIPLDDISFKHFADDYVTVTYKKASQNTGFCRIKAMPRITWIALDTDGKPDTITSDARFTVQDEYRRYWRIKLNDVKEIEKVTDLIIAVYCYIVSPENFSFTPQTESISIRSKATGKSHKATVQRDKGDKLYIAIDDYVVIDLETTSRFPTLENKIIEISALRVRDNEAVDTFSTLVNPGCHIPDTATQVNNITDEMVADAPELSDIFGEFIEFVGNDVLVGHNIDTFDLNILYDVSMELYNKPIENNYIDTYHLARKCLPELRNYRLETLAKHLGLNVSNMHRSDIDCELTKKLYDHLKPLCGSKTSPYFYGTKPKTKSQYAYAKVDQQYVDNNPFLGKTCIVYGAFQQLTTDQIQNIFKLIGAYYVDYFCHSADVLILGEDMYNKYISGAEDELIGDYLKLQKPVMSEYDFVSKCHIIFSEKNDAKGFTTTIDIKGKTVCLTGEFDIDSREGVINRLTELGAIVKKSVIKSLDYLIVGNQGSALYKNGSTGGKIEKANEFNENGANITIISEDEFLNNEMEMV